MSNPFGFFVVSLSIFSGIWAGAEIARHNAPEPKPMPVAVVSSRITPRSPTVAPTPPAPISPSPYVPAQKITRDGHLAALTESDLDEAIGYAVQSDDVALQEMFRQGRAIRLPSGIHVYLEECVGFLCSTVRIRPVGKTISVFTTREAID